MKITDLRGKLPILKTKKYSTRKLSEISSIAIHHSLTTSGSPEAFARYHVNNNNWPGIAYTYVVQRDGTVYQCHDHNVVSYHVGNSNKQSLGICMVGDFRTQQPTPEQYKATVELVRQLQKQIPTAIAVKGHSEYPDYGWKACPVIDMGKFRSDLASKDKEQAMTSAERKEIEDLKKQVEHLNKRMEQQTEAQAAFTAKQLAPEWFVEEFGSSDLNGLIADPAMTKEGWRTIAIALRAQGFCICKGSLVDNS